jgi:hypothetical protein
MAQLRAFNSFSRAQYVGPYTSTSMVFFVCLCLLFFSFTSCFSSLLDLILFAMPPKNHPSSKIKNGSTIPPKSAPKKPPLKARADGTENQPPPGPTHDL